MSTLEITRKFAGAEGSSIVPEHGVRAETDFRRLESKILLVPFMLEDYIDSVEAHAALTDPENSQSVPWKQLREELGL
jgi:hypothetical protein